MEKRFLGFFRSASIHGELTNNFKKFNTFNSQYIKRTKSCFCVFL